MKWISLTGIIPFIGGWIIFLTWIIARYQFALSLRSLETIGALWMIICFFIAIIGLIVFMFFLLSKRVKWKLKYVLVLFVIAINIPSVDFILNNVFKVQELAFIRIENKSNEKVEIKLISKKRSNFKTLEQDAYTVLYYKPNYMDEYTTESGRVEMKINSVIHTLVLPNLYSGNCKTIEINKDFEIVEP